MRPDGSETDMNTVSHRFRPLVGAALSLVLAASVLFVLRTSWVPATHWTPRQPNLESLIPARVGPWQQSTTAAGANPVVSSTEKRLYGEVLSRVYRDADGHTLMLSVAWGADQVRDALQAHRPEYCYRAFGFDVRHLDDAELGTTWGHLPMRRLLAVRTGRIEPVSYWMTVGETPVLPGVQREWAQFRRSLSRQPVDGLLIRVSSLTPDTEAAFAQHDAFIRALVARLPDRERFGLRGKPAVLNGQPQTAPHPIPSHPITLASGADS